jgi:mannosyltransferase OCH1-like enzyme/tetratricopeptide (TPR) repeat protein
MPIPKLLHIIWIGDDNKRPEECIASWQRLNPTFELRLWGNRELEQTPWQLKELMQRWLPREINGTADLMRWQILLAHGGVAVDADSVCLRPLEDWLLEPEVFAAWENEVVRPGLIATGALGAMPGHPFIEQILHDLRHDPNPQNGMAWQKLGPGRITQTYKKHPHPGVKIYPSHYFLPEHYTGQTYQGPGPVFARQLWASTRTYATRANGQRAAHAVSAPHNPKVSLCMIVKNEEKNLADCLHCCADLVDEIILVDTGSTDRTKDIAHEFAAQVFDFPWCDSFAAARNEALRHATGQWIFWMDADDRLDEANRQKLRALFADLKDDMAGYLLTCKVLPSGGAGTVRLVDHTRLFPNHPQVRWSYRVHEQILPSVMRLGGQIRRTDIALTHLGYQDEAMSTAKLQRNLRLMEMDHQEHPNDPFTLYNLGRVYERLGKLAEALPLWQRSLAHTAAQETYVPKLYYLLAQGHHHLRQRPEALLACLAGLARFPTDVELLFLASNILVDAGDLRAAEACLLRLLQMPREGMTLGDDPGLRTFKARCQLARIYRDQKRQSESEAQWQAALQERPDYAQALLGLGQVYLDQNRWPELDHVIARLQSNPQEGAVEAAVLRGLRLTVTQEFALAQRIMEETITKFPRALEPRILLGRLSLREGQDPALAEQVYRAILDLDPINAEAQRNLKALHTKKS